MDNNSLALPWITVMLGLMVLTFWVLASCLKHMLRRNTELTMMLAVRNAVQKDPEHARAHVAALRELAKPSDKAAAGLLKTDKSPSVGPDTKLKKKEYRFKQVTP